MPAGTAYQKRTGRFKKQKENNLQLRCARYMASHFPDVLFFCDASGVKMSDTQRIHMSAMRARDFRVPDMIILHPSRGYHGAMFELKPEGTAIYKKDGSLRKQGYVRRFKNGAIKRGDHLQEQHDSLQRLNDDGYYARFAVGYDAFVKLVHYYLDRPIQTELF